MLRALAVILCLLLPFAASADVPTARLHVLARGVNLTNWFRFPARQDDAFFRDYIGDTTLEQLHRAGFTFVRLAVQPELLLRGERPDAGRLRLLMSALARIERHGLGVMLVLHPHTWHDTLAPEEVTRLLVLWDALAQRLRALPPDLTFPEVMNEPVYPQNAAAWDAVQAQALAHIRRALPHSTVILTGTHWSAIDGLLAAHPLPDPDVAYTFHLYEPMVLTTLGDFDSSLDRRALRQLPFPVTGPQSCATAEHATAQQHSIDVIRYYCSEHWDAAKIRALVDQAADWSRRNHVPVVCGEFGASDQLPPQTRLAWLAAMRRALEDDGIGWALWGYDDSMGFHAHPRPGAPPAPLDPALLHALGLHG